MSLLRLTTALLAVSLTAALVAPAAADQVFSNVSTGPVHVYPTPGPYPLGDIYYSPCGWYGNYGGGGFGRGGHGGRGNTTLTGERFYPYDIGSNGNRIGYGHGYGHGNAYGNGNAHGYGNCYGSNIHPSPRPGRPIPAPYASRRP